MTDYKLGRCIQTVLLARNKPFRELQKLNEIRLKNPNIPHNPNNLYLINMS